MKIDLSAEEITILEIAYPPKPGETNPIVATLDFDGIAMDIQAALPTVMQTQDEAITFPPASPGAEPKTIEHPNGLQLILHSALTGKRTPEHLPNLKEVFIAFRRIFQVPDHCGPAVVRKAFEAWSTEQARRAGVKKNSQDSQSSPATTQALYDQSV